MVDSVLSTYNNLLEVDVKILDKAQLENKSSESLLKSLDSIAAQLVETFQNDSTTPLTIEKPNIAFTIIKAKKENDSSCCHG